MMDDILDEAPSAPLRWDGPSQTWCGRVRLPSCAGFQNRSGPYAAIGAGGSSDGTASLSATSPDEHGDDETRPPSPEQATALRYLMANEAAVSAEVGRAIVKDDPEARRIRTPTTRRRCRTSRTRVLRPLIGLFGVRVLPVSQDGSSCIGLGFAWDDAHGLGVRTRRGRVIDTGQADFAVTEWIAEEDAERPTAPD